MLTYFVLVPIMISVFLYLFSHVQLGRIIAVAFQGLMVLVAVWLFVHVREYGEMQVNIGNYRGLLGIWLSADYQTTVFVMVTTVIFLLAAIYSFNEEDSRLFWFLIFVWQASAIGIFLTRDLFNRFVLMEVGTMIVTVLIMFNRNNRTLYHGMLFMMINIVAVQFYLFGLGIVYMQVGVLDIYEATVRLSALDNSQLILPYALFMTFVVFKCALVPLFGWLPKALSTTGAPSSVSAVLAGLHIVTGIYMFFRFQSVFQNIAAYDFFIVLGAVTGIVGVVMAMGQKDIKVLLAYGTIAQIGLIMIGINLRHDYAHTGGLLHMVNQAVFQGALFLSAGIMVQSYGTRDINKIRGALVRTPWAGVAALVGVLGITATPVFGGSLSMYLMLAGTGPLVYIVMVVINLGVIIVFIRYLSILFGQMEEPLPDVKIETHKNFSAFVLAVMSLVMGIFVEELAAFLFGRQVSVGAYFQKTAVMLGSWLAGWLIYRYYVKESAFVKRINEIDIGFRGQCISIGVFFAIVLLTAYIGG